MTNKELTDLLTGLAKDRNAVREARDNLRHKLTALKTEDKLKRRYSPEGHREFADELRQEASADHRDKVARARLAAEAVKGMTREAYCRDYMANARLEIPAQPTAYASEEDKRREQRDTAILNELRSMRLSRMLERATPGELAERAKRAVASGTEAGVAELELIRQEMGNPTRTNLAEHRQKIHDAIAALRLPAADAAEAELAQKITAVAGAIERNFHELEHAQAATDEDRFASVARDQEYIAQHGHQAFRDSTRERAQAESAAVKQTADKMLRAAVLAEIKTEGEA